MKRYLLYFLTFGVIGGGAKYGYAQTCTIINLDTIVCEGANIAFSVATGGGTPISYDWNFGNGYTANTTAPAHSYTTSGNFTPSVTVTFLGGATCTTSGSTIKVRANPVTDFHITTDDEMCFKNNELCVVDRSRPSVSLAPIKQRAYQLSNGYIQIETPPYDSVICYRNNVDIGGHLYSLVMEITDTNGCVSKLTKKDSVSLFPKFERLSYTTDTTILCYRTKVVFTNTSLMPFTRVKKFRWVFGDGGEDSVNWFVTQHDYTVPFYYAPLLIVTDTQNCLDTLYGNMLPILILSPDTNLYTLSPSTQCYKGNEFKFTSLNGLAGYYWSLYDHQTGSTTNYPPSPSLDDSVFLFAAGSCGTFTIQLTVQKLGCRFSMDTSVYILGPKAIIETPDNRVVNGHQCEIEDTVYIIPFLSCVNQSGYELEYLWDFDDPFAPLCTLDTRRGINIGMNCRYAVDSVMVKHYYTPGTERCFLPSLYIRDTILGCEHQDWVNLPLQKPLASRDTTAVPPREGLTVNFPEQLCLNQNIDFYYPNCDFVEVYFFADSLCDTCQWLKMENDTVRYDRGIFRHVYEYTIDSTGWVTVGLVLANGELGGDMCYDTAWYHHFIHVKPIDANYVIDILGCEPYQVRLIPHDSIQVDLQRIGWLVSPKEPGPGQGRVQTFLPGDSIVQTPVFTINAGNYFVQSDFLTTNGCRNIILQDFSVGVKADFGSLKPITCVDDSVELFSDILYYNHTIVGGVDYNKPYWLWPERAELGKEKVWWNIGDGNGFVQTGGQVSAKYNQAGKYTIQMAYQDSVGCLDTLVKQELVMITDIKAYIRQLDNQYYCAPQIVSFFDSSIVYDELPVTKPSFMDSAVTWLWNFGDETVPGSLQHPAHQYRSNGTFNVQLVVTDLFGCKDTAHTEVSIVGPTPSFDIVDTLGCEPFMVKLINTTHNQLKSWTWYFGDSANQTLTTTNTDSVMFTYTKPGVYYLKLLGSQDIFNPTTGNSVNCNHFFPDPVSQLPVRKVTVLPKAPVAFKMADTICAGEAAMLESQYDSTYTKLMWQVSDGRELAVTAPDSVFSLSFDSVGLYTVNLIPVLNPKTTCIDSASRQVQVFATKAAFELDLSNAPHYYFTNQSVDATSYLWNFGKPSAGAANESRSLHANFDYGEDSADYMVCLYAKNEAGCEDSACRMVHVEPVKIIIPNVFTPSNSDGYNDAFDIDILGEIQYHLTIYNRWGTKVFEGFSDGYKNDGINWNGNDHQTGPPCAEGVYYYIFSYQFFNAPEPSEVHGTITLIRSK